MNLRRTLADALAAALPAYRVMGYATELDAVTDICKRADARIRHRRCR